MRDDADCVAPPAWGRIGRRTAELGDDMLPQPNWPDGHQARVDALLTNLDVRED